MFFSHLRKSKEEKSSMGISGTLLGSNERQRIDGLSLGLLGEGRPSSALCWRGLLCLPGLVDDAVGLMGRTGVRMASSTGLSSPRVEQKLPRQLSHF